MPVFDDDLRPLGILILIGIANLILVAALVSHVVGVLREQRARAMVYRARIARAIHQTDARPQAPAA